MKYAFVLVDGRKPQPAQVPGDDHQSTTCAGGVFLSSISKNSSLVIFIPIVTKAERPFYERSHMGSAHNTKTTASAVSFSAILSREIVDFGQQLSVCVDGIIEGKATD